MYIYVKRPVCDGREGRHKIYNNTNYYRQTTTKTTEQN